MRIMKLLWCLLGSLWAAPLLAQVANSPLTPPQMVDTLVRVFSEVAIPVGTVTGVQEGIPLYVDIKLSGPLTGGGAIFLGRTGAPLGTATGEVLGARVSKIADVEIEEEGDKSYTGSVHALPPGQVIPVGTLVYQMPAPPVIGVTNFTRANGERTQLGDQLAERLAPALQLTLGESGVQVLEPFRLAELLAVQGLHPANLFDATHYSADRLPPVRLLIAGTVEKVDNQIYLHARLVDVHSGRPIRVVRLPFLPTTETKTALATTVTPNVPTVDIEVLRVVRQLIMADPVVQTILRGPIGAPSPKAPEPPPPLTAQPISPQQVEALNKLLRECPPEFATLHAELRAIIQRIDALEAAVAKP